MPRTPNEDHNTSSDQSSARPRVRAKSPNGDLREKLRIALRVIAGTFFLVALLYGYHQTEQFLIRDERFALNGADGAGASPTLEIQGAAHASLRAIQQTFDSDMGRSVYLIPLTERRATLRTLDWVKNASVARVWPDRVIVRITERQPLAFVTLSSSRFGLIDEEGVILPPVPDRFHIPVLKGVRSSQPAPERRELVKRMMNALGELGVEAKNLTEVDVSDATNLKITMPRGNRMMTLYLGDRNYRVRYRNFADHYAEIVQKLPDANTFDVRLEDRITVVEQ